MTNCIHLTPLPKLKKYSRCRDPFTAKGFDDIWGEGSEHTMWAKGSALDWMLGLDKQGEVLYIRDGDSRVGITGWFPVTCGDITYACLRWHGVIPDCRGTGVSEQALELLAKRVPENIKFLVEVCFTDKPVDYFIKKGFLKAGSNEELIPRDDLYKISLESGDPKHILVKKIDRSPVSCGQVHCDVSEALEDLFSMAKKELKKARSALTRFHNNMRSSRSFRLHQGQHDDRRRLNVKRWRRNVDILSKLKEGQVV